MKTLYPTSLLNALVSLLIASLLWFALAPTQLGGQVTYIIVDGNSMEPKFHFGDLALMRRQSTYQVGDAVTYQNAEMGKLVFHRIVHIQENRFILQGDHNTWLDGYHPSQNEIIGKLWIHIPMAGKAIQWARKPLGLAIVCGLLGGIMLTGMILNPSPESKHRNKIPKEVGGLAENVLYLSGFMTVLFLALTIFAFTRPLTRPTGSIPYQQDVFFVYSAAGTAGVYDSNTIQPREPIFPRLTCMLNISLVYNITGNDLQSVMGSHRLSARVLDEKSGWQRILPLQPETTFNGNSYSTQATLDLCEIEALVASVEEQTGLHPNMYTLELIAHTDVTANLARQPISDSLDSILKFQFDKVSFHLPVDSIEGNPLHTLKLGSILSSAPTPNMLNFPGIKLTVQFARILGSFGLAIFLIGFLWAGSHFLQRVQSDPVTLIQLKYREQLMNVSGTVLSQHPAFVEVSSMDDLARLAVRQNTLITHTLLDSQHYYYVQSNGITYRYVVESANQSRQTQPRIYLPERIKNNFMDAIPVDISRTSYRVEIHPKRYTPADEKETVVLHRIRL